MKKILFLLFLLVASQVNAQFDKQYTMTDKDKILELYGDEWGFISKHDGEREHLFLNLLKNRIEVRTEAYDKREKYMKLSQVPLFTKYNVNLKRDKGYDPNTFNILKYRINFFSGRYQYFRIDGTDKVIFVKPQIIK